jgi:TPP-dependent pyruvate/acetoin dehydrogenase alpha subunit
VEAARGGGGPALIEADTYRLRGHSAADSAAYRPAEEVRAWDAKDPLLRQRSVLAAEGVPADELDAVDAAVRSSVDDLLERARAAPAPDPEDAWTDMWSDGDSQWRN